MRNSGAIYISALKRRWLNLRFLTVLFKSIAISLVIGWILIYFLSLHTCVYLITFILAFIGLALYTSFWKLDALLVCRYLDQQFPELEESASLLLKQDNNLQFLERFQQAKVKKLLPVMHWPTAPLRKAVYALIGMLVALLLMLLLRNERFPRHTDFETGQSAAMVSKTPEKLPAKVSAVHVTINPPAYTGLAQRQQSVLGLRIEEGSRVSWLIHTSDTVQQMKVLFNDKDLLVVSPSDEARKTWEFSRMIAHPGFYQIIVNGVKSDLYAIELIPDLPVRIKVTKPKQSSTIDYGQAPVINLQLNLQDEYGIKDAYIAVTMASGKGEGVSFSEKSIRFVKSIGGQRQLDLSQQLDLRVLGMKPGGELYFFIKAVDNRNQNSRSDVYFVSMVDTAELMSMNGMVSGVNLVPEYFRSQRQIIIDTEKLLKEQNTITLTEFKNRSNNLGLDQKLLRLRYGKFLGEENENEIGPGDEHADDDTHEHQSNEAQTKAIMDSYAHLHDVAEDATFFEPELKAQLKTVLTEMWKAELQLRTFKLQEALPFEYKALRLLKDLQQKSRAYVAKTSVKVPQLKDEKRLSGELDKILSPLQQRQFENTSRREQMLKQAMGVLEIHKTGYALNANDLQLLREVEKEMIVSASDHPSIYLPALKKLRKLGLSGIAAKQDLELITRSMQKMMKKEKALPQQPMAAPSSSLYQNYFKHLNLLKP